MFINFERFLTELSSAENFFSRSYAEARARWIEGATKVGACLSTLNLRGSSGDFLDYACVGKSDAQRVIIHIAGTHGVEGYLGAAIQQAIFAYLTPPPPDVKLIFIFCLNPWGMQYFRRTTEDNIDLNRNFRDDGFRNLDGSGVYSKIESFLNPKRKPWRYEPFLLNAAVKILQHGYSNLKQGIAGGQYQYPKGIYFGGAEKTPNVRALEEVLIREISGGQTVFGLEVHSGLGPFGYDTLFGYFEGSKFKADQIASVIGHEISSDDPSSSVGFTTSGDISSGVRGLLGAERTGWILQEFGTYSNIRGLKVLRNENMHHFYGDAAIDHWSKKNLIEFFNPSSSRWRRYVIGKGLKLIDSIVTKEQIFNL